VSLALGTNPTIFYLRIEPIRINFLFNCSGTTEDGLPELATACCYSVLLEIR